MYVKATSGTIDQFPYTISDLRRENPNTSFPKRISEETLEAWGVYPVSLEEAPSHDNLTQNISQDSEPTLSDGTWSLGWSITAKTAEEIEEHNTHVAVLRRMVRNEKLSETDWWASSDLTMTAEQTAYRQALRDITSHVNWPHLEEDDWPTKP